VIRVDLNAGVPGPRLTTPNGAPVLNGPFSARVGLTLFRGLGGGAFGPGESYALGGHAVEVATGDVDGDGLHDVAVGLTSDNDVAVLINTVGEEP